MKYKLLLWITLLTFTSCSDKHDTIDGSSESKFEASIDQLRDSINGNKLEEFNEAIGFIALQEASKGLSDPNISEEEIGKSIRKKLDGKTVDQIIEMGK